MEQYFLFYPTADTNSNTIVVYFPAYRILYGVS